MNRDGALPDKRATLRLGTWPVRAVGALLVLAAIALQILRWVYPQHPVLLGFSIMVGTWVCLAGGVVLLVYRRPAQQ